MASAYPECFRWAVAARALRCADTYAAIADELGLHPSLVKSWCRAYGVSRARVYVTPRVAHALDVLIARGRSVADMAEATGVPERCVVDYVKRHARRGDRDGDGR